MSDRTIGAIIGIVFAVISLVFWCVFSGGWYLLQSLMRGN